MYNDSYINDFEENYYKQFLNNPKNLERTTIYNKFD